MSIWIGVHTVSGLCASAFKVETPLPFKKVHDYRNANTWCQRKAVYKSGQNETFGGFYKTKKEIHTFIVSLDYDYGQKSVK